MRGEKDSLHDITHGNTLSIALCDRCLPLLDIEAEGGTSRYTLEDVEARDFNTGGNWVMGCASSALKCMAISSDEVRAPSHFSL